MRVGRFDLYDLWVPSGVCHPERAAKDLPAMGWDRSYYVYIMASHSKVLYIGSTSDLRRRVYQHRAGLLPGFTSKYRTTQLVYYEETPNSRAAVTREHQIKGWLREKKLRLVESQNAGWLDLAADWFERFGGTDPSLCSG